MRVSAPQTVVGGGDVAAGVPERAVLSLGEWLVTADPKVELVCLGLGSCVALCVHDPQARVGGMAHMVLPESAAARAGSGSGAKFVDVAVPLVLERMAELGALRSRLRVALVGGAQILAGRAFADAPQIGPRNVAAALAALAGHGLHPSEQEVGGTQGRTVSLSVRTGELRVLTAGKIARAG